MSERKVGKSSKIDAPVPAMPNTSWDFSEKSKPGHVSASEPNFLIHAFDGRSWEHRGVQGTKDLVMPRRQQFHVKIPKICG